MAMNAERIYHNALCALEHHLSLCGVEDYRKGAREIARNPREYFKHADEGIGALASILYDAGEEIYRSKGGISRFAAKKLTDWIPEHLYRTGLAWVDEEGRQCFCSGYYAVRLNKPIEGLPSIPEDGKPLDYAGIFNPDKMPEKPLNLPAIGEVKVSLASQPKIRGKRKTFDFGEDMPLVDGEYLKQIMILFPDAQAFWSSPLGVIYFKGEAGDALLCPIRRDR